MRIGLDAATGQLTSATEPPWATNERADTGLPLFRSGSNATRAAAASAGVKLTEERFVCNVARAGIAHACYWQDVRDLPVAWELPVVAPPHSRVHVRTATAQLTITRNAMVDLGGGGSRLTIDCGAFRSWPDALAACARLARGDAPAALQREHALMFAIPFARAERYFHFAQLDVSRLQYAQAEVHGLVGQRSIDPPASALARQRNISATSGNARVDLDAEGGRLQRVAVDFRGRQGEGAIAGRYDDYVVPSLHTHGGFPYARLACDANSTS